MQAAAIAQLRQPYWPDPSSEFALSDIAGAPLPVARAQLAAIEATLRFQIEGLKFLGKRLDSHLRLLENSQQPDHINDLFDVWCSFCQNAFIDYAQEGARIAEIGASLAKKTANRLHQDEKHLVENLAVQTAI